MSSKLGAFFCGKSYRCTREGLAVDFFGDLLMVLCARGLTAVQHFGIEHHLNYI